MGLLGWPAPIFDDGDGRHDASSASTVTENIQVSGWSYLSLIAWIPRGLIEEGKRLFVNTITC